eukprot:2575981-Alexandrium_andersonii.AAC.1
MRFQWQKLLAGAMQQNTEHHVFHRAQFIGRLLIIGCLVRVRPCYRLRMAPDPTIGWHHPSSPALIPCPHAIGRSCS